jgi:hypothetical protein
MLFFISQNTSHAKSVAGSQPRLQSVFQCRLTEIPVEAGGRKAGRITPRRQNGFSTVALVNLAIFMYVCALITIYSNDELC